MIENPFHNLESSEKISWKNIKVFRVRHGNTPYNEQLKGVPDESEIDLTEQGIREIEQAAENISQRLNKDEDVVCVVHSPRKRTRDSAQIIRNYLVDRGFTVWDDPKEREEQTRVRSTDILNSESQPIPHNEPAYAEAFRELLSNIKQSVPPGSTATQYWKQGGIDALETPESVGQRSKDQLAFLMRVAHTIQPKVDKHIAIVELEHEETLDDIVSNATDGSTSIREGNGPKTGEVFELEIPVVGDEVHIKSLNRDIEAKSFHFDYLKRDFKHDSN